MIIVIDIYCLIQAMFLGILGCLRVPVLINVTSPRIHPCTCLTDGSGTSALCRATGIFGRWRTPVVAQKSLEHLGTVRSCLLNFFMHCMYNNGD